MNIWLCKNKENLNIKNLENYGNLQNDDTIYIYEEDNINGGFYLIKQFIFDNDSLAENNSFNPLNIDLPYTLFYQTKRSNRLIQMEKNEVDFILQNTEIDSEKDIRKIFEDYIMSLPLKTKKTSTRIKYLDEILPNQIDEDNPISIFTIQDLSELEKIKNELVSGGKYYEWDRKGSFSGEILQTLNMYIECLNYKSVNKSEEQANEENTDILFQSFIKRLEHSNTVKIDGKLKNIEFIIGQPNTGKSFNFEEKQIFNNGINNKNYKYLKVPVSGGIGNEYKGLQNTDLAISYDPIKKELRFGEFLQVLMFAIVNPKVPHVIFLDDFHNQDISSLLSEYTPLFKSQQKRDIPDTDYSNIVFNKKFNSTHEFIIVWNSFIETHCQSIPKVPITNRISGESLYLVYPSNFYLLGAANFNQNSLNIFADWQDRAVIQYKLPIKDFKENSKYKQVESNKFFNCCLKLNEKLQYILEEKGIFDSEKYCFGMWKVFDNEQKLISNIKEQKELIRFFFSMIKNSLNFNNKNSLINDIGKNLFIAMQEDSWFKSNIETINEDLEDKEFYRILHIYNIYEDDI